VVVAPAPPAVIGLPSSLVAKAERGNPVAQFTLGSCYANGRGAPRDYVKAVRWYYLSARQGYAPAQNRLGVCYYSGLGTPRNYAGAVAWYRRAAQQGYAPAQDNLGLCYYYGLGVPRNANEAVKWYRLAAAQGSQAAAAHLRQGEGGPVATAVPNRPGGQNSPGNQYSVASPATPQTPPSAEASEPSSGSQLNVDEIKELASAGVKADVLIGQIKSTNSKFTQQEIAVAQQANVDPLVVQCMKENAR
jgi:TPR repeat protein